MIGQKFATPKIDYWCSTPTNSSFGKWSISKWRSFSSPKVKSKNKHDELVERCQIFDVSYDENLFNEIEGRIQLLRVSKKQQCLL